MPPGWVPIPSTNCWWAGIQGEDLASQPTLSRFENSRDRKQLFRLSEALADCVIERHRRRLRGQARRVTIDLDPTDDPTHGAQQLTFFNHHYDTYCYLPVVGFLSFDEEPDQYLVTAVLRPGIVPTFSDHTDQLTTRADRQRRPISSKPTRSSMKPRPLSLSRPSAP